MILDSKIKKYSKELHALYEKRKDISKKYDYAMAANENSDGLDLLRRNLDQIDERINSLIENEYAYAVYDKYNEKKPILSRVKTGEEIPWDEAFGKEFSKISKSLRHSLVGLVEEPGRYIFKK